MEWNEQCLTLKTLFTYYFVLFYVHANKPSQTIFFSLAGVCMYGWDEVIVNGLVLNISIKSCVESLCVAG